MKKNMNVSTKFFMAAIGAAALGGALLLTAGLGVGIGIAASAPLIQYVASAGLTSILVALALGVSGSLVKDFSSFMRHRNL
jgi:hypothetical protein